MSIDALIFDLDGTLADTEEGHRLPFNLAFQRYKLGWTWAADVYRGLLKTTGGKERLGAYIAQLPVSEAERRRLQALLPGIHAENPPAALGCHNACHVRRKPDRGSAFVHRPLPRSRTNQAARASGSHRRAP